MTQAVIPSTPLSAENRAAGGGSAARASPADAPMIRVENLGKTFKMYRRPSHRLHEWLSLGLIQRHTDFKAVSGVSFEVGPGECVGILGANGSGKSTLLKMLAGALYPSEGSYEVRGRTLSLIELGTGLMPLLTGRQNVVNMSTLLGFPQDYARTKMADIEDFAELGEFFDRPLRQYSTGMRVRLAFATFACFRPEVFIIDEALSVGDVFFQQKCATRMRELLSTGMTMLFVSHDTAAIQNLCSRVIVLERGRPVFHGSPEEGVTRYLTSLRSPAPRAKWTPQATAAKAGSAGATAAAAAAAVVMGHDVIGDRASSRHGAGGLRIAAARVTDLSGRDTLRATQGGTLRFHLLVEASEEVALPRVGVRLFDRLGNCVFAAGTFQLGHTLPPMSPGDRLIVTLDLTMNVAPGAYSFGLGASEPGSDGDESSLAHDRLDRLGPIAISLAAGAIRPFYGIARLPLAASHARVSPG